MYENLYKQIRTEADMILQGIHDTSPERTSARSVQRRGLAARTSSSMEKAMQDVSQQLLDDPRRNPENLKKSMAEYLASLDKAYNVKDEPTENEEDNADTFAMRGVSAPPSRPSATSSTEPATKRATSDIGVRLMRDLMRDYGLNKEYAAGIVGNLDYETGGFQFMQEISPLVKGSRGGFGFAQWTGPRRVAFEKWAKENELDPTSYEANYGFLKHELAYTKEGNFLDEHEYVEDVEQAARIFSDSYLRPSRRHANMEERIKRAKTYAAMKDV